MELQSYHSQCTSCEVCCQIWMMLSVISYFIKNVMSQQCCSYITLVASETSQYEVVAFETRGLDVRLALYGCNQYVEHFCRN